MEMEYVGKGSQYALAFVDVKGDPLDGGKAYKLHLRAMSSGTEIFFNRGKGKINPALIYARCCSRQNRRNKSMPAPHPRRYRTNHSTRVWSVQRARHLRGECRPCP